MSTIGEEAESDAKDGGDLVRVQRSAHALRDTSRFDDVGMGRRREPSRSIPTPFPPPRQNGRPKIRPSARHQFLGIPEEIQRIVEVENVLAGFRVGAVLPNQELLNDVADRIRDPNSHDIGAQRIAVVRADLDG